MKKRNIALAIVLSFITCGVYAVYWIACLNDDANQLAEYKGTRGITVVILIPITFGIYLIYWAYQMGKRCYEIQLKNGKTGPDNSVIYLILAIFGLHIVNYCLIQDELNKYLSE